MDNTTSRFSGNIAVVGDVYHELCNDTQGSIATKLTIEFCPDGRSALRLAGTKAPQIWFVAISLTDMSGFDCIDMLGQICLNAKFFLAADQYSSLDERRAVQLPRTRYVGDMTCREMLERLVDAAALASQFAGAFRGSFPEPVREPP